MEIRYHIVTLGCQMNKSDSERVRTVIENMGYKWTDNEEEANLLGLLACSVRQKSIDKVYSRIRKWNSWKDRGNLLTFISGCILPADKRKFLKLFDLLFSITELPKLPEMIQQYGIVTPVALHTNGGPHVAADDTGPAPEFKVDLKPVSETGPMIFRPDEKISDFWLLKPSYMSKYEAFIPIQNGCDKFCTFCAVPYTRGREISRPSQDILAEIKQLVEGDYKLITLLGQNVNSYGLDKNGHEISFARLLKQIGEFGEKSGREFWVYFTSPHPGDMSDEVIKVIASYRCLAKQIHLPLQSGDDELLNRMNRKHSISEYLNIIDSIREKLPDATIFTDIIVGFSGETRQQFENTRKAMERIKFNMAYIAQYSPRPGAVSAAWEDDIPVKEKKERLHCLTEELSLHAIEANRKLIGNTIRVMVTGMDRKDGYLAGLTEGRIVVRFLSNDQVATGNFIWLKITDATAFSIEGILSNEKKPLTVTE